MYSKGRLILNQSNKQTNKNIHKTIIEHKKQAHSYKNVKEVTGAGGILEFQDNDIL